MKKLRILVGMSGGVDSAVTAHLLKQQGHEIVAGFMKNYSTGGPDCTTRADRDSAIKGAQHLGIKNFCIFDFRKEYNEKIINYIIQTYEQGLTPNPDVFCNNLIKFELFAQEAKKRGFDGIATGHYARLQKKDQTFKLMTGVDKNKDQSYFLSRLSQKQLSYANFPIGELTKTQVRKIAQDIGLPNADRPDSQGLCFIGKVSMMKFLQQHLPKKTGEIHNEQGQKIGTHEGAYFYTIGQSSHINIGHKAYVTDINTNENIITVSTDKETPSLYQKEIIAHQIHRIHQAPKTGEKYTAKIRYRQEAQPITIKHTTSETITVGFDEPQRGVAPGQMLVIYDNETVIGNGIIQ